MLQFVASRRQLSGPSLGDATCIVLGVQRPGCPFCAWNSLPFRCSPLSFLSFLFSFFFCSFSRFSFFLFFISNLLLVFLLFLLFLILLLLLLLLFFFSFLLLRQQRPPFPLQFYLETHPIVFIKYSVRAAAFQRFHHPPVFKAFLSAVNIPIVFREEVNKAYFSSGQ